MSSKINHIWSSLLAKHFNCGSASGLVGNSLVYFPHRRTSVSSILHSHWLLQSLASKSRLVLLRTRPFRVTNSCIDCHLHKSLDFIGVSLAATSPFVSSCVRPIRGVICASIHPALLLLTITRKKKYCSKTFTTFLIFDSFMPDWIFRCLT